MDTERTTPLFASLLSAAGVPLEDIADVLGHDGTRMTSLVYCHAVTPSVSGALTMGDVFGMDSSSTLQQPSI